MAIQSAQATFNAAQPLDGDLPYIDVTWTSAFTTTASYRVALGVNVSDGAGPIAINFKTKTTTGIRVLASDQFTGTVELVAYDV